MASIHFIYASVSGHTEFVVDTLCTFLSQQKPDLKISKQRAELASPEELTGADVVILGGGTWNTGGREGQLSPFMSTLLLEKAGDMDLQGQKLAFISLGDDRYYFTTRCTEHFFRFQRDHHAEQIIGPLIVLNEPYDQEDKICKWGQKLIDALEKQVADSQI